MKDIDSPDIDLNAWADSVANMLRQRAAIYEQEGDPHLKRNKAAAMVGDLALALQRLPGVATRDLFPLKDVLIFSEDLDNGRRHPWSIPRSTGGTNYDSVAKTERQVWAVAALVALIDAGTPATKAYKQIAKLLKAAGRDVSYQRVQGWYLTFSKKEDDRLERARAVLDVHLYPTPCPHGGTVVACPASTSSRCDSYPEIAAQFATWAISDPTFRDWFTS